LKAGLWETRVIKLVSDGQDNTAKMADASARMQAAMANMPPDQRARMEAMMKERGGPSMGADGTGRICISPELANEEKPYVGKDQHCDPVSIQRSGNRASYTLNCKSNGETSTGKGEMTTTGDTIAAQFDLTTHLANGESHVRHVETEMKFLGTDCGNVKPIVPNKPGQ
jgi:hypothetical protein